MKAIRATLLGLAALFVTTASSAGQTWSEGTHYARLNPAQHTTTPAGKVEVMEVFSYGCPGCNSFQPTVGRLQKALPANAQLVFLPASFNPGEDWAMFQRAYFAAQALGIADRTHQAIFDAVWKTGELAISDPVTHRLKKPLPTIEDAARCYGRLTGVKPEAFLAAAKSFGVEVKMRAADAQVSAMEVPGTPCIVVNGKYRVILASLRSYDEVIDVVKFLVARETAR
jgi:thiol:disulfide interchange protein DsbA